MEPEREPSLSSQKPPLLESLRDILFSVFGFLLGRFFPHSRSDSTQEDINTVHQTGETESQERHQHISLNVTVRDTEEVIRERRTEANQQHRIQNSIRKAAWAAFFAASVYATITWFMRRDIKENFIIDQRAWISALPSTANTRWRVNQEILVPIQVKNFGKTTAKSPTLTVRIYPVKVGDDPEFVYTPGHASNTTQFAILFPSQSTDDFYPALRHSGVPNHPEHVIFTQDIHDRMQKGELWIVVHGVITYADVFGEKHWTHFCFQALDTTIDAQISGSENCNKYNDVGDGGPPEALPQ